MHKLNFSCNPSSRPQVHQGRHEARCFGHAFGWHLEGLVCRKEVSTEKREDRKRREKEEAMKNYYDVQKRKLDIDEANAKSRVREVKLKEKELELIATSKAKEVELKGK